MPTLRAERDFVEAAALARVAVAASPATAALIQYAVAEATALLSQNIGIVHSLVEALIAKGVLFTDEINAIIADGVAVDRHHRAEWKRRQASAAALPLSGISTLAIL